MPRSQHLISRATLTRLAIGLVIVALIVIGLTNPSGAQTTGGVRAETPSSLSDKPTLFARCLQDWDVGTHMTKQEWAGACQRLLLERGDYLRKPTR